MTNDPTPPQLPGNIDPELLNYIHTNAHRLHEETGMPLLDAYKEAVPLVFMMAAEAMSLEPFDVKLIEAVRKAQYNKVGQPVLRSEIIDQLEKMIGKNKIDKWTVWQRLSVIEPTALVYRPRGKKSRLWAAADIIKVA